MPGLSIIFAFTWKKGMRLRVPDEISTFIDLLRNREKDLYQRLVVQGEWLETCQRLYDGMLMDKLDLKNAHHAQRIAYRKMRPRR